MEDREMFKATCSDCGNECQVPFKPSGSKPVRCNDCFRKNRPERTFNNRGSFNNRPERTMHKATCAECKKECEVPFKPTGERPVLCRDCFRATKN